MHLAASRTRSVRRARGVAALCTAVALGAAPLVLGAAPASAASKFLNSANVPNYPAVLENSTSRTLYVLSTEKGAKLHCTKSACLKLWHPLVVKSSVKTVSLGTGVKGKIGFVKRSATTKQVTFNTWPLYTFLGDNGPNETNGEAVADTGGVWHLVHAAAKSAGATPFAPILNKISIPSYPNILANNQTRSLYILSIEKGASISCTGGCLSIWPPLLVPSGTTKLAFAAGVKGTIGFVTRGSMEQVTFNSYPVYTYTGDNGPGDSFGEGVVADGGTWTLANANATTATDTPVAPVSSGGGW